MYANLSSKGGLGAKAIIGLVLVFSGIVALLGQFFGAGWTGPLLVLGLGLGFLAAAFVKQAPGLLIPGGVVTGVGLGSILLQGPLGRLAEPAPVGVFLLALAAGWALAAALSLFFSRRLFVALIPAVLLAAFGSLFLVGEWGLQVLSVLGILWPLGLIVRGLILLLGARGR